MQGLDDDYANGPYIRNADEFVLHWAAAAQKFRVRLFAEGRAKLNISYGPSSRQVFDYFSPKSPSPNLLIFVHGGYWMKFDKSYWSHLAKGALDKGWQVALPSYDLCPAVRISQITRQIASAVNKIAKRSTGKIVLVGHSAGGHLVARMPVSEFLAPEVYDRISHIMPISPVRDLRPLRRTKMNEAFLMSEADAIAESPTLMEKPECDVSVWVGADERPVFLDQARWLAEAWSAPLTIDPAKHHFNVIEGLEDMGSKMLKQLLRH